MIVRRVGGKWSLAESLSERLCVDCWKAIKTEADLTGHVQEALEIARTEQKVSGSPVSHQENWAQGDKPINEFASFPAHAGKFENTDISWWYEKVGATVQRDTEVV